MKMWIEPFLLLLCRWFGFCVSDTTEISQSYESVKEQLNNYREAYVDTKYQHYLRDLLYVRIKTNRSFINKECLKEEGLSYFKWAHQTISKYHLNDTQFVRDVQNRKEWLEQRLESMVAVKDVDMQYLEEIRNIREPNPSMFNKKFVSW
uniref:P4Ha_N domain-containing protein n=1 Tax=Schistosoma mansoni TaxID=6183 RepID=A0A5K4F4U1_SCHMA